MEIIIEGWRSGGEERREAAVVPTDQLPVLTEMQKAVAKKMGISEVACARSAYAGARNQERLLAKTKSFAAILGDMLCTRFQDARIERIRLVTIDHEYRIEILAANKRVLFRVSENMVNDFIEAGSEKDRRAIESNLQTVVDCQAA